MRRFASGYTVATVMCTLGLVALFTAALWPQPDMPLATTHSAMDQFQHDSEQSNAVMKNLAVSGIALFVPGVLLAVIVAVRRHRQDARTDRPRPGSVRTVMAMEAPPRRAALEAGTARPALPSAEPQDRPQGSPRGGSYGSAYDSAYGSAYGSPHGSPHDSSYDSAYDQTHDRTRDGSYGGAYGDSHGASAYDRSHDHPYGSAHDDAYGTGSYPGGTGGSSPYNGAPPAPHQQPSRARTRRGSHGRPYTDSYDTGAYSPPPQVSGPYDAGPRQDQSAPLGTAVVLGLRPTGAAVPDRPGAGGGSSVELELRVRVSAYDRRPPFETTVRMPFSRFSPPSIGDVMRVRIDASRAEHITVLEA